jgi:hypothetical protein
MIELEPFEEFDLPGGSVWIGDPEEVFDSDDWHDILDSYSGMYKGAAGCLSGSADFFLIDLLEDDPVVSVKDHNLDEGDEDYIDDVSCESGYIMVIAVDQLELIKTDMDIEALETGSMFELEKDEGIRVSIKGVRLGDQILILR